MIKISNDTRSPTPLRLPHILIVAFIARLHLPDPDVTISASRSDEVVRPAARGCPCDGGDGVTYGRGV